MAVTHVLQYKTGLGTFLPVLIRTIAGTVDDNDTGTNVAIDSTGSFYVCGGMDFGGTGTDGTIVKFDSGGNYLWSRRANPGASGPNWEGMTVDSSDNVIVVGSRYIFKYNSSGVLQWQRQYFGSTLERVTTDSSGNIYAVGRLSNILFSGVDSALIKIDPAGNLLWQRVYGAAGGSADIVNDITIDNAGNIILVGDTDSNTDAAFVLKFNSSGSMLWQKSVYGANGVQRFDGVAVDSSDNIFVAGHTTETSHTGTYLVKFSSAGAKLWEKTLLAGSQARAIVLNGSDLLVLADGIHSFDLDGNLQWQRTLNRTVEPTTEAFEYMVADTVGNLFIGGRASVTNFTDFLVFRVPKDGSGIGTYTDSGTGKAFSYYSISNTVEVTSNTGTASGFTVDTPTQTFNASTLGESAATVTVAAYV